MNWLHCNKCGVRKSSDNSTKFFCGSCSHVLCKDCNTENISCPIDNRPFKGIEINNSMPYKMRIYFEDLNKQVASWQKSVRFQCEQRSLCEQLELLEADKQRQMQLKKEIGVLTKAKDMMIKNIEIETKRNKKMKAYFKHCARKNPEDSYGYELFSHGTSSTSTAYSLNVSSVLEESGGRNCGFFTVCHQMTTIDLEFDELNKRELER